MGAEPNKPVSVPINYCCTKCGEEVRGTQYYSRFDPDAAIGKVYSVVHVKCVG